MCYLVAKRVDDVGCVALQTSIGRHLADFTKKLMSEVGIDNVQLITISRPSAYGEYDPYHFVDTEEEFEKEVKKMA